MNYVDECTRGFIRLRKRIPTASLGGSRPSFYHLPPALAVPAASEVPRYQAWPSARSDRAWRYRLPQQPNYSPNWPRLSSTTTWWHHGTPRGHRTWEVLPISGELQSPGKIWLRRDGDEEAILPSDISDICHIRYFLPKKIHNLSENTFC